MGSVNGFFHSKKAPIHPNLLRKPFPHHWQNPKIDSYNGTIDPNDHINLYLSFLQTQTLDYELLCRAFPGTIKGNPYHWFISIPTGSVTSFVDLSLNFMTRHMGMVHIKHNANTLLSLR